MRIKKMTKNSRWITFIYAPIAGTTRSLWIQGNHGDTHFRELDLDGYLHVRRACTLYARAGQILDPIGSENTIYTLKNTEIQLPTESKPILFTENWSKTMSKVYEIFTMYLPSVSWLIMWVIAMLYWDSFMDILPLFPSVSRTSSLYQSQTDTRVSIPRYWDLSDTSSQSRYRSGLVRWIKTRKRDSGSYPLQDPWWYHEKEKKIRRLASDDDGCTPRTRVICVW